VAQLRNAESPAHLRGTQRHSEAIKDTQSNPLFMRKVSCFPRV
jgi:hypothetical protein